MVRLVPELVQRLLGAHVLQLHVYSGRFHDSTVQYITSHHITSHLITSLVAYRLEIQIYAMMQRQHAEENKDGENKKEAHHVLQRSDLTSSHTPPALVPPE